MIAGHLSLHQLFTPDLALGELLADLRLFVIGQTTDHRACGHEHGGHMAECSGGNDQARHDLVADAKVNGSVKNNYGSWRRQPPRRSCRARTGTIPSPAGLGSRRRTWRARRLQLARSPPRRGLRREFSRGNARTVDAPKACHYTPSQSPDWARDHRQACPCRPPMAA